MPGFLLHQGAPVTCSHGGQGQPTAPSLRVLVAGQPIVTAQAPYAISLCGFAPPNGNGPCVTAQWLPPSAAIRVQSDGAPVLLQTSQATCLPTGTPVVVGATQVRVRGA